jgi:rod shape-determining protein MreC
MEPILRFFSRYRFPLLLTAFLLGALALFSFNAGREPEATVSGRLLLEILGPAQKVVSWMGDGIGGVWNRYFALVQAARQSDELKRQVAKLRQQLTDLEELKQENERLRDQLKFKSAESYPVVAAQVVGVDPTNYFRSIIINKGSRDGVRSQMPAINAKGVVGRVIWSSPSYAKVLLLIDPNAAMDVLVQRTRARGIVEGAGRDAMRLKYIQLAEDVAAGDSLISTGADGVFPKGMLVGLVRAVKHGGKGVFQSIDVEPAVDFERLEEVLVILHRRDLED